MVAERLSHASSAKARQGGQASGTSAKRVAGATPGVRPKLDVLRRYLGGRNRGFVRATWRASERCYLELSAGPGQQQVKGTAEVFDGSPLIALKAGPPYFTRLFWVDSDRRNVASLESHRRDHSCRKLAIYHGNANRRVHDVVRDLPEGAVTFAFLDSSAGQLNWRTITTLAKHSPSPPKIEMVILLDWNEPLRPESNEPGNRRAVDDELVGTSRQRRRHGQRRHGLHQGTLEAAGLWTYVRALREQLGYKCVPLPRVLKTHDGRPASFLIFASDNPVSEKTMQWSLRHTEWEELKPPQSGRPSLSSSFAESAPTGTVRPG